MGSQASSGKESNNLVSDIRNVNMRKHAPEFIKVSLKRVDILVCTIERYADLATRYVRAFGPSTKTCNL